MLPATHNFLWVVQTALLRATSLAQDPATGEILQTSQSAPRCLLGPTAYLRPAKQQEANIHLGLRDTFIIRERERARAHTLYNPRFAETIATTDDVCNDNIIIIVMKLLLLLFTILPSMYTPALCSSFISAETSTPRLCAMIMVDTFFLCDRYERSLITYEKKINK